MAIGLQISVDGKNTMQRFHFLPAFVIGALTVMPVVARMAENDEASALRSEKLLIAESVKDSVRDTETPPQQPTPALPSVKCEEAEVSPVTGHAECVRPRGAAVDSPPQSAVPCSGHHAAGDKRGCPGK